MRLEFSTQSAAQAKADEIHTRMLSDQSYKVNVDAGITKRWAVPYQDLDDSGSPLNASWWVNLKPRVERVLTTRELADVKPYVRSRV